MIADAASPRALSPARRPAKGRAKRYRREPLVSGSASSSRARLRPTRLPPLRSPKSRPQSRTELLTERNHPMANFTAADVKALRADRRRHDGCQEGSDRGRRRRREGPRDHPPEGPEVPVQARGPPGLRRPAGQRRPTAPSACWSRSTPRPTSSPKNQKFIDFSNEVLAAAVAPGAADLTRCSPPHGRGHRQGPLWTPSPPSSAKNCRLAHRAC